MRSKLGPAKPGRLGLNAYCIFSAIWAKKAVLLTVFHLFFLSLLLIVQKDAARKAAGTQALAVMVDTTPERGWCEQAIDGKATAARRAAPGSGRIRNASAKVDAGAIADENQGWMHKNRRQTAGHQQRAMRLS